MCIWALCLLGYCGEAQQVISRLGEIQKGFGGYLVGRYGMLMSFSQVFQIPLTSDFGG